jgi:hypothetical protein
MISEQRCVAPDCDKNDQCSLIRISHWHCSYHSQLYSSLYHKYKEKQKDIESLLFTCVSPVLSVVQLWKQYSKIREVCELRRTYRKLAFLPQFWDRGHDKQIEYCLAKLKEYEDVLNQKYKEIIEIDKTEKEINANECNEEENDSSKCSRISPILQIRNAPLASSLELISLCEIYSLTEFEDFTINYSQMITYRMEMIQEEEKIWSETIPNYIKEHDNHQRKCLIYVQLIDKLIHETLVKISSNYNPELKEWCFAFSLNLIEIVGRGIMKQLVAGLFYIIRRSKRNMMHLINCASTSEAILKSALMHWRMDYLASLMCHMIIDHASKFQELCYVYWIEDNNTLFMSLVNYTFLETIIGDKRKFMKIDKNKFKIEEVSSDISLIIYIPEKFDPIYLGAKWDNLPSHLSKKEQRGMFRYYK